MPKKWKERNFDEKENLIGTKLVIFFSGAGDTKKISAKK
jgi:hypothetical protein